MLCKGTLTNGFQQYIKYGLIDVKNINNDLFRYRCNALGEYEFSLEVGEYDIYVSNDKTADMYLLGHATVTENIVQQTLEELVENINTSTSDGCLWEKVTKEVTPFYVTILNNSDDTPADVSNLHIYQLITNKVQSTYNRSAYSTDVGIFNVIPRKLKYVKDTSWLEGSSLLKAKVYAIEAPFDLTDKTRDDGIDYNTNNYSLFTQFLITKSVFRNLQHSTLNDYSNYYTILNYSTTSFNDKFNNNVTISLYGNGTKITVKNTNESKKAITDKVQLTFIKPKEGIVLESNDTSFWLGE